MPPEVPHSGRRQRIGSYEILQYLATGGMGAVYKARHLESGLVVALKVLAPETAAKPNMLHRFINEAKAAAKLQHPNIVAIYEHGHHNGTYFLALEFVDGGDLNEYITQSGTLEPDEALEFLFQATQALDHAYEQNVVHRDIKPANFLLTKDREVKLTDLGLAIDGDDTLQFRLTKAGNTVGTVDYISPEQARNSRNADTRSDIYSLGCTFYHMLAGQPPFVVGGLGERLMSHMNDAPPDVLEYNPDVPPSYVRILKKMLAKNPDDRYQTPAALLEDLEDPEGALADELSALTGEVPKLRKKRRKKKSKAAAGSWVWLAAGGGTLLLAGILALVLFLTNRRDPKPPVVPDPPAFVEDNNKKKKPDDVSPVIPDKLPEKKPEKMPEKKPEKKPASPSEFGPELPSLPSLVHLAKPIDWPAWRKEYLGPFAAATKNEPKAKIIPVSRGLPTGSEGFRSLAEAWAAIKPDEPTIIEIRDQGPLYASGLPALVKPNVTLRAGEGFRPLIAWDTQDKAKLARPLFQIQQGKLAFENLDFAVKWLDAGVDEAAWILSRAGEVNLRGCTFSQAGKLPKGTSVLKAGFVSLTTELGLPVASPTAKFKVENCYCRGLDQRLLQVLQSSVQILVQNSLVLGSPASLVQVAARPDDSVGLRLIRSTFLAGQNFLQVQPEGAGPKVQAWLTDALLSHSDPRSDQGDLIVLDGGMSNKNVDWQALNSVYAGWQHLLRGKAGESLSSSSWKEWRQRWPKSEGEKILDDTWPHQHPRDPAEARTKLFLPYDTPACFAALSSSGALGCVLGRLPDAPRLWAQRTYEKMVWNSPALPEGIVPTIPENTELYAGERIDLNKVPDLGVYLQQKLAAQKPAPRVVLHLAGGGKKQTSPVTLKGFGDLAIFFELPSNPKLEPLTLLPNVTGDHAALFDLEAGNLELTNARIEFTNKVSLPTPRHMLKVRAGNLTLNRCQLKGPLGLAPDIFQSLIWFGGAGESDEHDIVVNDSLLQSGKKIFEVVGPGVKVRAYNSVLLAVGDAFCFDLTSIARQPNVHFLLENSTFAFRKGLLHFRLPTTLPHDTQPIRVQAVGNLFADPFLEVPRQSYVVKLPAPTVAAGILLWQGHKNGFDQNRLAGLLHYEGDLTPHTFDEWMRLWGNPAEIDPVAVEFPAAATFSSDQPAIQKLIPGNGRSDTGADIVRLGFAGKK